MSIRVAKQKRLVAAFLSYFLGWFGAHRFYVNKKTSGTVQVLLNILFVALVIGSKIAGLPAALAFLGIPLMLFNLGWHFTDFVRILFGKFTNDKDKRLIDWT